MVYVLAVKLVKAKRRPSKQKRKSWACSSGAYLFAPAVSILSFSLFLCGVSFVGMLEIVVWGTLQIQA